MGEGNPSVFKTESLKQYMIWIEEYLNKKSDNNLIYTCIEDGTGHIIYSSKIMDRNFLIEEDLE